MYVQVTGQTQALRLQHAIALHQAGRLAEAETQYNAVLHVQKRDADATHLLAMLMHQRGETANALRLIDRALKLRRDFPAAHNTRGLVLTALGRHRDAVASFDRTVSSSPGHALAWMNRGHALAASQRHAEALASYERAIAAQPGLANAQYAKGILLQGLGRAADAQAAYDQALLASPEFPEALNNRATVLERLGHLDDALADYARALTLRPAFVEALNNYGVLLDRVGRSSEARRSFERAVALNPGFTGALMNLVDLHYIEGRRDEALGVIAQWLAVRPGDFAARIFRLMFQLPILYVDELEISRSRSAYFNELTELRTEVEAAQHPGHLAEAVAVSQPFFLAYQGHSDRDFQRILGGMVGRIMADHAPAAPMPQPPQPGARIRIGIVTGFFRQHPVWRIPVQGWVTQLDRSRFEVFGYHTSGWCDAETKAAAQRCDRFVQGPLTADAWRTAILADAPHVLLYPEVGMDRMATVLAAQRLAPVQCNSLGHPDTSGLLTLDYFITSAEMEPDDGDAHYTERLIRLPGLGIHYEPRIIHDVTYTRADLGLRSGIPIFWCGQSLYKYLPQYDDIYPRIARAVGPCQFAFVSYPRGTSVTELFRARLARAFAALQLDAEEYCVFLPRFDGSQFAAAIGQCDVVLDSIGWAGFNSNLESLAHNKPIVTFAGPLMRSCHTAAAMRVMGLGDTVSTSVDAYVALAAELGSDPRKRDAFSSRIAANKHRLYRDPAPITALETVLEAAVRSPASAGARRPVM